MLFFAPGSLICFARSKEDFSVFYFEFQNKALRFAEFRLGEGEGEFEGPGLGFAGGGGFEACVAGGGGDAGVVDVAQG